MLKEIMSLLKTRSALKDMFDEFDQMIEKVERMFRLAIRALIGDETARESARDIYAKDKEVNEHERSIRRKIVTHLTVNRGNDVPACLVLMSIVKDAERTGDYCKNIYELTTMSNINLDHGRYKTPLRDLANEVEVLFDATKKAFHSSDESLALRIMAKEEQIKGQCAMLVKQLVVDSIPTGKAVVYTLAVRYIRRVSGHLANIATSVAGSVENLDFGIETKK